LTLRGSRERKWWKLAGDSGQWQETAGGDGGTYILPRQGLVQHDPITALAQKLVHTEGRA